jgi:patatin-like phospholipase/acyl hydrolase
LQEVEKQIQEQYGQSITEYFDMIAGTSTGSLIAAGLTVGYTPTDMIDIYKNQGLDIFPYQSLLSFERWKLLLKYGLSAPKFFHDGLIKVVCNLPKFKKTNGEFITLAEAGRESSDQKKPNTILLILAYDAMYRNTTFFTNYHRDDKKWFDTQPLWKICVSSASAPTFFPACELNHIAKDKGLEEPWSFPHVDGGVTANNPALCAISQAIELGHRLEDIQLLSIGTGQNKKPLTFKTIQGWGLIEWGLRIADVFMEGQADVQSKVCLNLLGGLQSNRYLRLQFDLNDSFDQPRNYLAQAPIKENALRVNRWLKRQVTEAMDDARPETVGTLLEATESYLEQGNLFATRFDHYGSIKENIKQFVLGSKTPRERIALSAN